MSNEEIEVANQQKKAQLEAINSELSQLKPGRKVYIGPALTTPNAKAGQVLFETKDLNRLRSNVAKELKNLN